MLAELRFVQGAVAKKDLIPAMKHFVIEKNTIRSYNGSLALCSPLPFNIDCKPHAIQLVQAIGNCSNDHTVTINMTPGGKLSIKNGPFRALVDCIEEETPHVNPEGEEITFNGEALLKAFRAVLPFVASDASRPWANGVLLSGQSIFATNNVTVVEYWLGTPLPFTVNVPKDAVKEILRVGETPTHVQLTHNSITFHFDNGKWIRSQLFDKVWPDLSRILDVPNEARPIDSKIFEGVESIRPFADKIGNVYFRNGALATHMEEDIGAQYQLDDFPHKGAYSIPMLELLSGVVESIDWSLYPGPCIFYGENLRGAIIGRRIAGEG